MPKESLGLSSFGATSSAERFLNILTFFGILIYFGIAIQLNLLNI
jgi:preprotein translocase subunit SecG